MDGKFFNSVLDDREEALFKKRTVTIEGAISPEVITNLKKLCHALALKSDEPITLLIDSTGGAIDPVIEALHYFVDNIKAPLIGRVSGRCASAAVTLLQACKSREATRHSWFLVHSVALNTKAIEVESFRCNAFLSKKLALLRRTTELNQREMVNLLSQRTGRNAATVQRWLKRGDEFGDFFRATEAKKMGLIDKIL